MPTLIDGGSNGITIAPGIWLKRPNSWPTSAGADCSGRRRGNLYLQYWFYYPGSATAEGSTPLKPAIRQVSAALGKPSFHPDD
jgi:hypothetical protein